jgi:tRNA pseudouridine32 synthase/23S rRNA pseudouridine746 synthase
MLTGKQKIESYFHEFQESVADIPLPNTFTYPFFYVPHPLAKLAAEQVKGYLENQNDFEHDFGFSSNYNEGIGKMFGVLVVQNKLGKLGFLASFSGKLANSNSHLYFVPPIFDILQENSFFLAGEAEINALNTELENREKDDEYFTLLQIIEEVKHKFNEELIALKQRHTKNKQLRDALREKGVSEHEQETLRQQSIADSYELKQIKREFQFHLGDLENKLAQYESETVALKKMRKQKSNDLQKRIFSHYVLLNAHGEKKDLVEVFKSFNGETPPAGSGECAGPKLLNHAYLYDLKPICMAEFWWGRPPLSEVRKHGDFYPACRSKCEPILGYMLQGLSVDENPIQRNYGHGKEITILFEDDAIIVVNKPEGLLSVPGKHISDSVITRLKTLYPDSDELLLVHRLDMSTSGLLIAAKTKQCHKFVQRQFIQRKVKKRYVAVLNGELEKESGIIDLPMRVDLDNRPRQLICYEYGKKAVTRYEVKRKESNKSYIYFYPETGRTHQLRLHAAHKLGLNTPILGDDLYGVQKDRLYLHAEKVSFIHPKSKEEVTFTAPADF